MTGTLIQGKDGEPARKDLGDMKHDLRIAAAAMFAATVLASPAMASDADNGLKISKRWCASCHVVAPDQKQAVADVPTYAEIARKTTDYKALILFLTKPPPHGQMPDMALSQPEIADIVTYISTLGPNPIQPTEPKAPGGLSGAIKPQK